MGAYETSRLRRAQEAVDATATAYADDAELDVEHRLDAELSEREVLPAIGSAVIEDLSRDIRAGHTVQLTEGQVLPPVAENAPGSMGGDNGGG